MQDNLKEIQDWHDHFRVPGIDIKETYVEAAQTYDEIMTKAGTIAPVMLCDLLKRNMKKEDNPADLKIVDFGCGTGLVGERLVSLGFKNITGLDMSPAMMQIAKEKKIYQELRLFEMGKGALPEELKGKFDVATAAAVFIPLHAPPQGFDDMLDSLKVGGLALMSCSVKDWSKGEYSEGMKLRQAKGLWKLEEELDEQNYPTFKELARHDRFFAFRKLK